MDPKDEAYQRLLPQARRVGMTMVVLMGILPLLLLPLFIWLVVLLVQLIQHPSAYRAFSWTDTRVLVFIFAFSGILDYIAVVGLIARSTIAHWEKRLSRADQIGSRLEELQTEHPELVALKSVLELVNEEKDEVSSSRSFWMSFGQNLFFLALGFAVSFALAKLGWVR